jgi:ABC-2 type transport system permease protein
MRSGTALVAVARLDFAELLRSRWLAFCVAVYSLLAGIFVFVAMRESTVLGFTGMGRVLLSFVHVLVLLLPLLALTGTTQVLAHARDEGALELLLSQPISRRAYFNGVAGVRYFVLLVPLVALVVLMSAVGTLVFGEDVPWSFVGRALAISAALLWAFVGLGLAVSTLVRNQAKAMMYGLLVWALGVALLDFALVGMMLAWRLDARAVFLLAALNPVESARIALLSTAQPELGVLGPVGFFLSTRVGAAGLLAIGVGWPAAVGTGAFALAAHRFCRDDLI